MSHMNVLPPEIPPVLQKLPAFRSPGGQNNPLAHFYLQWSLHAFMEVDGKKEIQAMIKTWGLDGWLS